MGWKMKKKKILLLLSLIILFIGSGYLLIQKRQSNQIVALYPRSQNSFVGDPMPYFDGKQMRVYYLDDARDGEVGFHPFHLLKTKDFYHYHDVGEVISYVNEESDQERALGTGSIIRDKKGQYHAFYTAHNGSLTPKEKIMHAVSRNGDDWQKIPSDTFAASSQYEANDFRDPYVFWHPQEEKYWMLLTTRTNQTGVIAKYTSSDLSQWEDEGVFYENDLGNDSNLECPSYVFFEGNWYLAFSDQWDQRVVHYRVWDEKTKTFEQLDNIDFVDGAGFYAGRLETDGENLYLVGWIPTKENHDDRFKYNWAGNLATHQLIKNEKNQLIPKLPTAARNQIKQEEIDLLTIKSIPVTDESTLYYDMIQADVFSRITLSVGRENHLLIDFENLSIGYYNSSLERIEKEMPLTNISFHENKTYDFKLVVEDDILVIYLGEKALSNRIYLANKEEIMIESEH